MAVKNSIRTKCKLNNNKNTFVEDEKICPLKKLFFKLVAISIFIKDIFGKVNRPSEAGSYYTLYEELLCLKICNTLCLDV